MATKTHTVKNAQTVWDLSLQLYGTIKDVFTLINDNSNLDNVHSRVDGENITYTEQQLSETRYYSKNSINITTGLPTIGSATNGLWILRTGFWDDEGIWIDDETWND